MIEMLVNKGIMAHRYKITGIWVVSKNSNFNKRIYRRLLKIFTRHTVSKRNTLFQSVGIPLPAPFVFEQFAAG